MNNSPRQSMSLANPEPKGLSVTQKIGVAIGFVGLLLLTLAYVGVSLPQKPIILTIALLSMAVGVVLLLD